MKIFKTAFFLIGLHWGASVLAQPQASESNVTVEIQQGKPVKVRYVSKRHRGDSKTVLLKDQKTGKRVLVSLPLKDAKAGLYEGTFVVLFDKSEEDAPKDVSTITLDVYPIKATSTKISQSTDIRQQNVVLLQNNKQEKERIDHELAESKKRAEAEKKAKALSEKERQARKLKAQETASEAMALYKAEKYAEALAKFQKSMELDPENNKYYYQYGVCLFQLGEYQKSLVALSMAEDGDFSRVDKNYFIGMNYYRLNDADSALKYLVEVREENDELLSATASYYAGLLQYNSSRFDDAKSSFSYVLDKSKNPRMDENAESYLEKIDAINEFNAKFKDKWSYNLFVGAMYDSNVLSLAAADAPTDLAGLRFLYGGSLERRLIYDYFTEWSVIGNFADIYTTNSSLEAKESLQNADPFMYGIKAPYKWKTTLYSKSYVLSLTPGYETILMNADAQGPREDISDALYFTVSNSLFHTESWVANYDFDVRSETSHIETTANEDLSALRISLGTTQIYIADAKEGKTYIADLYLINNGANGDNQKYNRVNLGLTYAENFYWKSQAAVRLDLGYADYNQHELGRKDTGYGLTLSANKNLSDHWSTSLSGGYSQNASSEETYSYNKFTISNMYTYTGAF